MADWTDGPEYAPNERPDAYVAVGAVALTDDARPDALPPAPVQRPDFGTPPAAVPLDAVGAPASETRDPAVPFAVAATALTTMPVNGSAPASSLPSASNGAGGASTGIAAATSAVAGPNGGGFIAPAGSTTGLAPQATWAPPVGLPVSAPQPSAWGAVHAASTSPRGHDAWAPQQPLALADAPPVNLPPAASWPAPTHVNPSAFPTPDAQAWTTPTPAQRPYQTAPPVNTAAILEAADPLVIVALAAGGLLPFATLGWSAPPLLATAFLLVVMRGRYRRKQVRNLFATVSAGVLVLAALATADAYTPDLPTLWNALCGWAQLACWVLIPLLLGAAASALHRGEQPEQP